MPDYALTPDEVDLVLGWAATAAFERGLDDEEVDLARRLGARVEADGRSVYEGRADA